MRLPEKELLTDELLMLWIIERFTTHFSKSAILKGGMHLALLSSQRSTNDLDYTFVPFRSKSEVIPEIERILSELTDASIQKTIHSTSGRFIIKLGRATTQVEFNVSESAKSEALSTEVLAKRLGVIPRIVRVLSPDVELANKIAAWNERRLLRDLYDIYYWYAVVGVLPDLETLTSRLSKIKSRLPRFRARKKMTLDELLTELLVAVDDLTETAFYEQLGAVIPAEALAGVFPGLRAQLRELVLRLKRLAPHSPTD